MSDLFEGDITDIQIFEESGILKHINPYDIILADRGFTVQDLLNPLQAKLMIPAFLKVRKNLNAAEELSTRKIGKARIHNERFKQRLKSFRLLGKTYQYVVIKTIARPRFLVIWQQTPPAYCPYLTLQM